MKYKVGDKVRVRKDLVVGKEYGGRGALFGSKMKRWRGKTVTIDNVYEDEDSVEKAYVINEDPSWLWTDEMFEPIEPEGRHSADGHREIRILVDGRTITAIEGEYKGVARCSPEDEFDLEFGVRLAVVRLEESKAWPQIGDACYKINFCGSLGQVKAFSGNVASIDIPAVGKLIFRTQKEAQKMADRLNKVLEETTHG